MRSLIVVLVLSLLFVPLNATAAGYHYTHSSNPGNGQAILIKSTPGVLHTVTINGGLYYNNQYIYLVDTNSASKCVVTYPPTAPVIAYFYSAGYAQDGLFTPVTLTYDLTTRSGLCFVNLSSSADITVTWN